MGTCQATASAPCSSDAATDLAFLNKLELVLLYSTERFNIDDVSDDPILRDSAVEVYDFNPSKRYTLKSTVNRGQVVDERQLFSR